MMDARENAYVLWFDELRRADVGLVGGKILFSGGTDFFRGCACSVRICDNSQRIPLFHGKDGTE